MAIPDGNMTIGEVAAKCGVTFRLLRFYEQRGMISPNRLMQGGLPVRLYPPKEVERLQNIQRLTRYGFTLSEIKAGVGPREMIKQLGNLRLEIDKMQHAAFDLAAEIGGANG